MPTMANGKIAIQYQMHIDVDVDVKSIVTAIKFMLSVRKSENETITTAKVAKTNVQPNKTRTFQPQKLSQKKNNNKTK